MEQSGGRIRIAQCRQQASVTADIGDKLNGDIAQSKLFTRLAVDLIPDMHPRVGDRDQGFPIAADARMRCRHGRAREGFSCLRIPESSLGCLGALSEQAWMILGHRRPRDIRPFGRRAEKRL